MQLASFTHGALNPLRICVPRENHTILSIKYSFVMRLRFLPVISLIQVYECVGVFYFQLCSAVVMGVATGLGYSVPCVRGHDCC